MRFFPPIYDHRQTLDTRAVQHTLACRTVVVTSPPSRRFVAGDEDLSLSGRWRTFPRWTTFRRIAQIFRPKVLHLLPADDSLLEMKKDEEPPLDDVPEDADIPDPEGSLLEEDSADEPEEEESLLEEGEQEEGEMGDEEEEEDEEEDAEEMASLLEEGEEDEEGDEDDGEDPEQSMLEEDEDEEETDENEEADAGSLLEEVGDEEEPTRRPTRDRCWRR